MKLIPFALIFASAIFCSTIRNKINPTPTPLPTLGGVPTPTRTASPSPTVEHETPVEPEHVPNNSLGSGPKGVPGTISGGVLNGKATSLPKPAYPPSAKAVRASGSVSVQILVDEKGSVVSATAVSGHPLLRQAAVDAAKNAKFSPTMLSGKTVKVSGVLTFNFTLE